MAEVLFGYTHTKASELENKGSDDVTAFNRTSPNPQNIEDQGLLAKLVLHPNENNRIALTLEGRDQDVDTQAKRLSATVPKVTNVVGTDAGERRRESIEWEHKASNSFYDKLTLRGYHQDADTDNQNVQTRTNTSAGCSAVTTGVNTCLINQQYTYSQATTGGGVQLESAVKFWSLEHLFTYGVDVASTKTEEFRDLTRTNLTNGVVSKTLAGDTYLVRDFPTGYTNTAGIFVQDEMSGLADVKLSLIPGLRYDYRSLKPEVDDLSQKFLTANNRLAVKQTDAKLSPKIAALWQFNQVWDAYAQAVGGFRAPNYNEVNGTFRNAVQQYAISPNPDLKPETSIGVELGTKWHRQDLRGSFAVYDNHYKNFIENISLVCPADPRCIAGVGTTFINDNISSVRIYGAEVRSAWDFASGCTLDGALAVAHGNNNSTHQPLNTVEPARLSLGLAHQTAEWGAEGRIRSSLAVTRTDNTGGAYFKPSGYSVADLSAWWHPTKNMTFNVAANNLFDKKYFLWSDIRQADSHNPVGVDFYSQPGRNISASLNVQF